MYFPVQEKIEIKLLPFRFRCLCMDLTSLKSTFDSLKLSLIDEKRNEYFFLNKNRVQKMLFSSMAKAYDSPTNTYNTGYFCVSTHSEMSGMDVRDGVPMLSQTARRQLKWFE